MLYKQCKKCFEIMPLDEFYNPKHSYCKDCTKEESKKRYVKKDKKGDGESIILAIGDLHSPFIHKDYFSFIKRIYDEYNVTEVVFMGDIVDNNFSSYHEIDPDGYSAGRELELAIEKLKPFYDEFPNAKVCYGNHDDNYKRKAKTAGLPSKAIKSLKDVIQAPVGWEFADSFEIDGVLYAHGIGNTGVNASRNLALKTQQSAVQGHLHTNLSTSYISTRNRTIFGMCVGCGINVEAYAFSYQQFQPMRPMIGCGIIKNGTDAIAIPMIEKERNDNL